MIRLRSYFRARAVDMIIQTYDIDDSCKKKNIYIFIFFFFGGGGERGRSKSFIVGEKSKSALNRKMTSDQSLDYFLFKADLASIELSI